MLIDWYVKQKISLPWRDLNPNLYRTWISEIMLQQSQVKTVIPYFNSWFKKFPDITSLANATIDEVLKSWEGLGYYRRAHYIHKASKLIIKKHNGKIPDTYVELIKVPGIGDYTASAILGIGHNLPFFAVDGNFIRVFSRVFKIKGSKSKLTKQIKKNLSQRAIIDFASFNQAVMDLGRTICRPIPACSLCPISIECLAHKHLQTDKYPQKSIKKNKPNYNVVVGIIYKKDNFIITQRKNEGLLGGLWELPGGKIKKGETRENALIREIREELNITIDIKKKLPEIRHEYSHFKVKIYPYICSYNGGKVALVGPVAWGWMNMNEVKTKSFPKATHKVFNLMDNVSL